MTIFASDLFNAPDDTNIEDNDANWIHHPSYGAADYYVIYNNGAHPRSTITAGYYRSEVPPAADQKVTFPLYVSENSNEHTGVMLRFSTTENTGYLYRYWGDAGVIAFQVYQAINNTFVLKDSYTITLTVGNTYTCVAEAETNGSQVDLRLWVLEVDAVNPIIDAPDTDAGRILDINRVGHRGDRNGAALSGGYQMVHFSAEVIVVGHDLAVIESISQPEASAAALTQERQFAVDEAVSQAEGSGIDLTQGGAHILTIIESVSQSIADQVALTQARQLPVDEVIAQAEAEAAILAQERNLVVLPAYVESFGTGITITRDQQLVVREAISQSFIEFIALITKTLGEIIDPDFVDVTPRYGVADITPERELTDLTPRHLFNDLTT